MSIITIDAVQIGCTDAPLLLGYAGEDSVEAVDFDFSSWVEEYGAGTITLEIMRASDTAPYTPLLTIDGTTARWTISDVDTARRGPGVAQLIYTPENKRKKSAVFKFYVGKSIRADDDTDPWQDLLNRLEELLGEMQQQAADTRENAEAADQSAQDAATSESNAEAWAVGERGGDPVPASDPTFENNAKYYAGLTAASETAAEEAAAAAAQSESNAAASAAGAAQSQASAAASETAAAGSATAAASSAAAAQGHAASAASSASAANGSATAARDSERNAAASASAAAQSENDAAASATGAAQSAASATASKNAAAGSASSAAASAAAAQSHATSAGASATAASGSATAAGNAQTAAEAAQAAAEDAQEAAEAVLASIPSDYTELSEDVDDLKSALVLNSVAIDLSAFTWQQGEIKVGTGINGSSSARIRTSDYYALSDGAKRLIVSLFTGYKIYIAWYTSEQFQYCTPFSIYEIQDFEIPVGATRCRFVLAKVDNSAITPSEYVGLTNLAYYNSLGNALSFSEDGNVFLNYTEGDGYYGTSGEIRTPGATYKERYTSRISAFGLDAIHFDFVLEEVRTLGVDFCFWAGGTFSKKEVTQTAKELHISFDVPDNADYIAIYYRTFGLGTAIIAGHASENEIINDMSMYSEGRSVTYDFDHLKPGRISINHRGYHVTAPENTLPAFRLSKRKGFNFIETDVHFTADTVPVPVCIHDDTLNRTCCNADGSAISGTVSVASSTYADLMQYDACTPAQWNTYNGTKIPTFAEVLTLCKNLNIGVVIELKSLPTLTQVEQLVNMVKAQGMERAVIWLSGDRNDISKVVAVDQSAYVAVYEAGLTQDTARVLSYLKTDKNRVMFDCAVANATSGVADICEAFGLDAGVYSPNDEATIRNLDNRYVMITSDTIVANELFYDDNIGDPDTGLLA